MKILLAVDGSEYSAEAVGEVAARPWPPETAVRVVSAVETITPPAPEFSYEAGADFQRTLQELRNLAEQWTAGAAETLRASGLTAETAVRDGDARSVIVDEARDWQADLIVVGTHGRTGLKRWLLGSVAQAVVGHAPCSVEVVRKKPAES
jgi:nucleotide-binding universal stress UspA family protein